MIGYKTEKICISKNCSGDRLFLYRSNVWCSVACTILCPFHAILSNSWQQEMTPYNTLQTLREKWETKICNEINQNKFKISLNIVKVLYINLIRLFIVLIDAVYWIDVIFCEYNLDIGIYLYLKFKNTDEGKIILFLFLVFFI